ncbi:hypothetical protein NC652_018713 [Populus alba x Populus x berolinensis]|nr:hypothetical protein NC652_018713 [Populus alba x Populus x berolinensis]
METHGLEEGAGSQVGDYGEYHDKKERPDHLTTHTQVTFSLVSILEKVKPHYHSLLEDSVTKTSLSDTEGQYEVEVQWSKAQSSEGGEDSKMYGLRGTTRHKRSKR